MKHKIHGCSVVRGLIQIAFFLWLPGWFADTFHAIRNIYVQVLEGAASWENIGRSVWILAATIPTTILLGRFFCGFFCSFGAMGDLLWWIGGKLFPGRKKVSQKADEWGQCIKYLVLIFVVVLGWSGWVAVEKYSPWTVFGQLTSLAGWKHITSVSGVGVFLFLLIAAGSLFIERFFCRYLCPMGAIYRSIHAFSLTKIVRGDQDCGGCQLCSRNCSMGIPLQDVSLVTSPECIKCMKCVAGCPRKNLSLRGKISPWIPVVITGIAIGISHYEVRQIAGEAAERSAQEITVSEEIGPYPDGTYQGSARGYRGETQVTVTVENGNIVRITVDASDDDDDYLDLAKGVIGRILEKQDVNVDAVSGATLSSFGIIKAARSALPEAEVQEEETEQKQGNFTDGIYRGTADAFRGEVEVEVTVEKGNITDVRVISYYDDEQYLDPAIDAVIPQILKEQKPDVDAVAGATISSNGIMKAVANALGIPEDQLQLKDGGELSTLHGNHGHRVKKYK